MKKVNFIKIGLDLLLLIVFVLLFNRMVIVPMVFHQIAGLFIGGIVIIHIALNYKWVKQVTLKLFSNKINLRTKFGYLIDILLLLCFVVIIISGIPQSKIIFPNNHSESISLRVIHISVSYVALLLAGIHIGLHWNWVANVLKKIFVIKDKNNTLRIVSKLVVILLVILGSYNMYSVKYFSKVSSGIVMTFSGTEVITQNENLGDIGHQENQASGQSVQGSSQGGGTLDGKNKISSPNAFKIIFTYMSVISVFSIITFYLDKLLVKRKLLK